MSKLAWISIFGLAVLFDSLFGTLEGVVYAIGPVFGQILGGLISAGGAVGASFLGNKDQTVEQVPLETPEQTEARKILLAFAKQGKLGDITAGAEIPGAGFGQPLPGFDAGADLGLSLGEFGIQPIEERGMGAIEQLLTTISPDILGPTGTALEDILEGRDFDAFASFGPFKERLDRELKESTDAFKRSQAFGGSLFGTGTQRGLSEIQSRGAEQKAIELFRLQNEAEKRRAAAIPQALQFANLQNQLETSRLIPGISAALQFGGLERQLGDVESLRIREEELRRRGEFRGELGRQRGEELTDISRRRSEELMRLDALRTVLGSNAPFGVPQITVPQPSPFQGALETISGMGGDIFSNALINQRLKNLPPPQKFQQLEQFAGSGTATA